MSLRFDDATLKATPLRDSHLALGAKMVPFAGYEMPVQYPLGILKEHLWTREKAGLFDVSHMGQAVVIAEDGRHETASVALEALVPGEIRHLPIGKQRYTQLLNSDGGIIDDVMVVRPAELSQSGHLVLVVNAARKIADFQYLAARLPLGVQLSLRPDNALIALQGPASLAVLELAFPNAGSLAFMASRMMNLDGADCRVTRSGYTGEDGFEIAMASDKVGDLWLRLLADERVKPIGLGARDSLRLEAGLCLYGHDIDETTSPIEAGLAWSIQKRRRVEGGFPGTGRILRELRDGPSRVRVGIRPDGRAPAREGTQILSTAGEPVGRITSGGFGPSLDAPIAMGYVNADQADPGQELLLVVRGKPLPAHVVRLPFVPHNYARGS